jgi:NAD(P)-dependent dehydrogenase (short-subunit alcohol dehydrogenase family)
MSSGGAVVIVGGTRGIGLEIVRHYVDAGANVVLTGQDDGNVAAAVEAVGGRATGIVFDLAKPVEIKRALAGVGPVRYLILVAIDRDHNTIHDFDIDRATRLVTLKLVGFAEVIHTLLDRLDESSAIVLFGGQAKDIPYPGSITVSTVNGGVEGLARALVHELKPIRVNVLHPGIVGDSPYWAPRLAALDATRARTPTGRLATMADIVSATAFLLENESMNGVYLKVDGGIHAT